MSEQAKEVEDAFAELADLTDTAAEERRQRAEAATKAAVKQMNQDVTAMKTAAAADWRAMQVGIDRELKEMEAQRAARKHERDVSAPSKKHRRHGSGRRRPPPTRRPRRTWLPSPPSTTTMLVARPRRSNARTQPGQGAASLPGEHGPRAVLPRRHIRSRSETGDQAVRRAAVDPFPR